MIVVQKAAAYARDLLARIATEASTVRPGHPTASESWLQAVDSGALLHVPDDDGAMCRPRDPAIQQVLLRPAAFLRRAAASGVEPLPPEPLAFTAFSSERKSHYDPADAASDASIFSVEDDLRAHLQAHKSVHLYVVVALPDGRNYANLVVGRALRDGEEPMALMDACPAHRHAVLTASPRAYQHVSITSGTIHGSIAAGTATGVARRTLVAGWGDATVAADTAMPSTSRYVTPRADAFDLFPATAAARFAEMSRVDAPVAPNASSAVPRCYFPPALRVQQSPIRVTSFMSGNTLPFYRALFEFIAQDTGLELEWVEPLPAHYHSPWGAATHKNIVDVAFMCGVEFGRNHFGLIAAHEARQLQQRQQEPAGLANTLPQAVALAAPVRDFARLNAVPSVAPRQPQAPVYNTILIARQGLNPRVFDDLKGTRFAYNERISWSGFLALDCFLRSRAPLPSSVDAFCSATVQTASHAASMAAVAEGEVDFATIDAVVLDEALHADSSLCERIHVLDVEPFTLAQPWPMPLCAGNTERVSPWALFAIAGAMARLERSDAGAALLKTGRFLRLEAVTAAPYAAFYELLSGKRDGAQL